MNPDDRKYTSEHEWIKVEDGDTERALAGITVYAQDQLGDIVYFELPQVGDLLKQLEKMGEVESVKAVSDLFAPASGSVVEVNERLANEPELANEDPFGEGWLLRVSLSEPAELESLMSAEEYETYTAGLH